MAKKKQKKVSNRPKQLKQVAKISPVELPEVQFFRKYWLPALVLFLLSFFLYFQAINFGYVLDDKIVITDNSYTKKGFDGIWDILSTESFQGYFGEQKDLVAGARYRPLSIVTFAVEYGIVDKLDPGLSHLINILIYGFTCLLLFRVLLWIFPEEKNQAPWFLGLAFLVTLIWTVQPIHTEAVANIKGRDEILSLFFALGSIYFAMDSMRRKFLLNASLSSISLFLALMSKEGAITFLGIIPMTLFFFTAAKPKKILSNFIFLVLAAFAYLYIRYQVIGYFLSSGKEITDLMNNPFYGMTGTQKSATIAYTLFEYLRLSVFPFRLTHDYYPYHIPISNWLDWKPLVSLILNAGLLIIAIKGLRKKAIWSYAILFYFMALSIASNILFPVGTFMNERFIFSASVGTSILIAWVFNRYLYSLNNSYIRNAGLVLFLILVTTYASKTLIRVPAWENATSLNRSAVQVSKNSARANCFMATAIFNDFQGLNNKRENIDMLTEAYGFANHSTDIFPAYKNANIMVAGIASEMYKLDNDLESLLQAFVGVLSRRPDVDFVFQFLEYLNQRVSSQRMVQFYLDASTAVSTNSRYRASYQIKLLQYAEQLNPSNKQVHLELGTLFRQIGQEQQANYHFARAQGI